MAKNIFVRDFPDESRDQISEIHNEINRIIAKKTKKGEKIKNVPLNEIYIDLVNLASKCPEFQSMIEQYAKDKVKEVLKKK